MHADPLSRPTSPPRGRGVFVALALVVAVVATIYVWRELQRPVVPSPATPGNAQPEAEATAPPPAPAIRHPIEDAGAPADPAMPLPELAQSDAVLASALATALAGLPLDKVLVTEGLVRRFVVTVDNLPRKSVPARVRPVQPAPGLVAIEQRGDARVLGEANAARYANHMRVLDGANTDALVALYVRYYPLFQEAYRELGYPNGYFNDRMVEAIDSLLATPELHGPIGLVQPRVLYEFADPGLEALPAGRRRCCGSGPPTRRASRRSSARFARALPARQRADAAFALPLGFPSGSARYGCAIMRD